MEETEQKLVIEDSIRWFHPEGNVFELCAIHVKENKSDLWEGFVKNGVVAGWYRSFESAAKTADDLDKKGFADGIYITANPCTPALLARANERLKPNISRTTDKEIVKYSHFIIDIDPIRPKGISSTDEENKSAVNLAYAIREDLRDAGWPEPLVTNSGNGAYLVYKVDLENTASNGELLKKCLEVLSNRYTNGLNDIDCVMYNSARLIKLFGTYARKGDSITERPHRRSCIIEKPDNPSIVPVEKLVTLSGTMIVKEAVTEYPKIVNSVNQIDIPAFLKNYNIEIMGTKPTGNGGTIYLLKNCVFNQAHIGKEASIIVNGDGSIVYQCFHNSCKNKTWADAIKLISGEDITSNTKNILSDNYRSRIQIYSLAELSKKELQPRVEIVEDIITQGLTTLNSKPKAGKSIFVVNLGLSVALGTKFMDRFSVQQGSVLYLALEDTESRIKERVAMMLGTVPFPDNFMVVHRWNPMSEGGLEQLQKTIEEYNDLKLVIIDTLGIFRGATKGKNQYQEDYETVTKVKKMADSTGTSVILVHHLRKMKSDDPYDQISGTTGIPGGTDTNMILKSCYSGNKSELILKGRDIEDNKLFLELDGNNLMWRICDNQKTQKFTENEEKIINLLGEHSLKSCHIESMLEKQGINVNTTRSLLSRMTRRGLLNKLTTGLYELPNRTEYQVQANDATGATVATGATSATVATDATDATVATDIAGATNATSATDSTDIADATNYLELYDLPIFEEDNYIYDMYLEAIYDNTSTVKSNVVPDSDSSLLHCCNVATVATVAHDNIVARSLVTPQICTLPDHCHYYFKQKMLDMCQRDDISGQVITHGIECDHREEDVF